MSNIKVKTNMSPFPIPFDLCIDELATYLDETNTYSSYSFNIVVAILLHANNVALLFELGSCLQRLLTKLFEFFTSSSLDGNVSRPSP